MAAVKNRIKQVVRTPMFKQRVEQDKRARELEREKENEVYSYTLTWECPICGATAQDVVIEDDYRLRLAHSCGDFGKE
jgi:hypothetical protein